MTGILEYPTGSSAAANVSDRILQAIIYLGDPEHTRLPPERELAEMLGVERGTIRTAITELATLGLVTSRRGRYGGTSWTEVWPLVLPHRSQSEAFLRRAQGDLAMIQDLAWSFMRSNGVSIEESLIERAEHSLTSGRSVFWSDARLNGAIWTAVGGSVLASAASTAHLALVRGRRGGPPRHTACRVMLRLTLRAAQGRLAERDIADRASEYARVLGGSIGRMSDASSDAGIAL